MNKSELPKQECSFYATKSVPAARWGSDIITMSWERNDATWSTFWATRYHHDARSRSCGTEENKYASKEPCNEVLPLVVMGHKLCTEIVRPCQVCSAWNVLDLPAALFCMI